MKVPETKLFIEIYLDHNHRLHLQHWFTEKKAGDSYTQFMCNIDR